MKPSKVLFFIAGVLAGLALLCVALPGNVVIAGNEVRWPTIEKVLGIEEKLSVEQQVAALDYSLEPMEPLETPLEPTESAGAATPAQPAVPVVEVNDNTDSRIFLQRFYASLEKAGEQKVRVLHYGDSQIEEDRMTQQIREGLQAKYGGSGVGLMPLMQTIPTNTVRQELRMNGQLIKSSQAQQGPSRYLAYGPKKMQRNDGLYGVMGQVAIMADSLVEGSEELTIVCKPQIKSAHYDTWHVFADPSIHYSFSGDTVYLTGRGAVYGLSQESETGVIVDNIPMRGCLGTNTFTKIDSAQLASFCQQENVQLIILQFGGNAIPSNEKPETIKGFVTSYRKQLRHLRNCAPQASFLFIGPSDMIRLRDGEWQTYPMVAYMDRLLQKMALEEHIAYFSLYQWMGGEGSMLRWQENGLASKDGVHFYRSGANKAGKAVVEWLLGGMKDKH